jgi:hypothetical protein
MSLNAALLMFLKKPSAPGAPLKMRNTIGLREHNAYTKKLASPLPDQQEILLCVTAQKYVSVVDRQDTYKQF